MATSEMDCIRNPHLCKLTVDNLYHLGLNTKDHDFPKMFGDVQFVCMGGTAKRMKDLVEYAAKELKAFIPNETTVQEINPDSHRYSMYKVGPVLAVSHGVGTSSLSVVLEELFKLVYYAKCKNVTFMRLGTCGGIGVAPGTVIITNKTLDGTLKSRYVRHLLFKEIEDKAELDADLAQEIHETVTKSGCGFDIVLGATMCAGDFYEGQGRLDGAVCSFEEADKNHFLETLRSNGVKNIEMECTTFAAKCLTVNIKCAIICVALVNRFDGDQVKISPECYKEFEQRPAKTALIFIKNRLGCNKGKQSSGNVP